MTHAKYTYVLVAAIIVGVSHLLTWAVPIEQAWVVIWKGASVGLLALFAGLNAREPDGYLLTVVLALSALSDVLIVTIGAIEGGIVFMIADVVAIVLYTRNLAHPLLSVRSVLPLAIIPLASLFGYFIVTDRAEAANIGIFVLPLAAMTAFAWLSQFPYRFVAIGATLVLMSDLLIFTRQGPLEGIPALSYAVWFSYFLGEVLICVGVVTMLTLRRGGRATRHRTASPLPS
jgi:YhhN family